MGKGDDGSSDDAHTPLQSPRSHNTSRDDEDSSNANESDKSPNTRAKEETQGFVEEPQKGPTQSWKNLRAVMACYHSLRKIKRTKSNQRWMKLRTTVQISSAMQKKPPLKREDSFLKRFSTRQIPETQETVEDTGSEGGNADDSKSAPRRRRRIKRKPLTVVNPDENFYFYWLMVVTVCLLYNMWTLIVRQSFPEFQVMLSRFWISCDLISDVVFVFDIGVQLRTGYLEQGLMVYNYKKLAGHYLKSRAFLLDLAALTPLDILQVQIGVHPILRFPRFFKVYRSVKFYYIVESRTVWPNLWRVINLIHILLILAHWFGCFYYLLSEAEGFQGDWVYPYRPGDYATLARKYLGSLYWSTLTLTTIGDLPTPETNAENIKSVDGPRSLPRRGIKSRLLQFRTNKGYVFTIVSYLIGVFIFATIVGQVGNVITNRNANRLEFERLLDGAKTYMRHHKVPGGMKRRVLRWYDYSWSRGRIQGGGDINTALGLLPDKLKTELALHVNLSVLKKVTIFQECQPEFLHDLVLKMKAYIFTPGDSICRKGEVAREMFIIADGILEVLSENGKVLTSMKAGDFFGEIGILNLDGLNKRTADVRSVGYSELFSLSREDVLAAMKDYPEAQEILQNLGRKRLMEVKASAKQAHHRKDSRSEHGNVDKGLVGKIRHEAKGLRKVIKKSRTRRSDDECLELQPLHAKEDGGTKSVLKRMSRVKSHDLSQEDSGSNEQPQSEPVTSPLGAGLPLLARLRLLKEKQEHEDRTSSANASLLSPCPTAARSPPLPDEQPTGSGLPFLQRVLLLKNRDEPLTLSCSQPTSPTTTTTIPSTASRSSISFPASSSKPLAIPSIAHRISFRDRLKLHKDKDKVLTIRESKESKELRESCDIAEPSSIRSDSVSDSERSTEAPWSKLKKAAIVRDASDPCLAPAKPREKAVAAKESATKSKPSLLVLNREVKNYKSIEDLSPEYGGLPFVKKLKILNERQKLAELESEITKRSFSLDIPDQLGAKDDTLTRSRSEGSKMHEERPTDKLPSSPSHSESNETLERRHLKSILKKLSEEVQVPSSAPPVVDATEFKRLMRAPTIEGDTLPSPPGLVNALGGSQNIFPGPIPQSGNGIGEEREEEGGKMHELEKYGVLLSSKANQMRLFKGTIEEDYGEMLIAIKQIMTNQIQEMQENFQQKFVRLENEIKTRDQIINQLRAHILDLERANDSSITESIDTIASRIPASWEDPSTNESIEIEHLPRSISPRLHSVIVDVESDTDAECESELGDSSEPGYESGEYENNSNWELEMLADQMRKKRSASLDYGSTSKPPVRRRVLRGGSADTHKYD
ncbi:cyclic nucleotide-gated cation channel beta-3 isoform X2 [Photinus pyralis]|uniref:cyclic nucleotide-gated cation channel beta-3 isoform X2 n=1 Tax=Photinus pyralis TaxID=7054 RepID=UPI0012672C21|nr:cyclic nucleotide-gated cation channel beta-3 isoform X2 [Photinus pyralis]